MRLLLAGGGTAGHVYPALAVMSALKKTMDDGGWTRDNHQSSIINHQSSVSSLPSPVSSLRSFLWVGSIGGMEAELVTRAGLPFEGIQAGGVRGMAPWVLARNLGRLMMGYTQAERILKRFKPHVVFATGGYVGVPVVVAAKRLGIPSLVYLPDIQPGLAVKALARLVDRICVTFDVSRHYLPGHKVVETGYPVRAELEVEGDKTQAATALGLDPDVPTVLIFGGSRGARRINQAALGAAARLVELAQVIHITGELDAASGRSVVEGLPETVRSRYHIYAYLHGEMVYALRAAHLVVSRAGAATLGEYPAAGLPAILVPLPISGGHQWPNAEFLAQAGGATIVPDAELTADRLEREIRASLSDPARLAAQAEAMRGLARPHAACRIGEEIVKLAG